MICCIDWTCFWRKVDFRTSHCKSSLCMHGEKIHAYGMRKIEGFRPLCRIAGHHQPISIDKVMCLAIHCQLLHALAHNSIAFFNTILPHSLSLANRHCYARNIPAMPTGKGGWKGIVWKPECDAIVSKCLWWLTMNGKAHNFVYWNWLMMSSRAKMIRMIFWRRGLAMSPKIRRKNV